jgi:hypothetical protein
MIPLELRVLQQIIIHTNKISTSDYFNIVNGLTALPRFTLSAAAFPERNFFS